MTETSKTGWAVIVCILCMLAALALGGWITATVCAISALGFAYLWCVWSKEDKEEGW